MQIEIIKNMKKQTKGITLVALVVTIIVLLILAGVAISLSLGNNGIFQKAVRAKEQTEIASEKEKIQLALMNIEEFESKESIKSEDLENEINANGDYVDVMMFGETFIVKYNNSNRYYEVKRNGNVSEPQMKINDEHAGDITKGGTCNGSKENPFEISCIEDLVTFSIMSNDGNAKLKISKSNFEDKFIILTRTLDFYSILSYNDHTSTKYGDLNNDGIIDSIIEELTNTDEGACGFSIMSRRESFKGELDGKNNQIKNIYQNTNSNSGLFYTNEGTIKNLKLSGNIYSSGVSGTFAYFNRGEIINCYNFVNVNSTSIETQIASGGICARNHNLIDKCVNYGTINSANAGGIVGRSDSANTIIRNCGNYGEIKSLYGSSSVIGNAGGIIAFNRDSTYILNSYNVGKIIANNELGGGIIGCNWQGTSIIKNVYTTQTSSIIGVKYIANVQIDNVIIKNTGRYNDNYMKSSDFVDELNLYIQNNELENCSMWKKEDNNSNNTYPIFVWQ